MVTTLCRASSALIASQVRPPGRTATTVARGGWWGRARAAARRRKARSPLRRSGSGATACGGAGLRRAFDRQLEPVATSRNRRQRARPQQLAQRRDLHLQVVLLDHQARPDERQQLVLRYQPARTRDQHHQQIERPRAQRHRLAVREQAPLGRLQREAAETAGGAGGGGRVGGRHGFAQGVAEVYPCPPARRESGGLHVSATFKAPFRTESVLQADIGIVVTTTPPGEPPCKPGTSSAT